MARLSYVNESSAAMLREPSVGAVLRVRTLLRF